MIEENQWINYVARRGQHYSGGMRGPVCGLLTETGSRIRRHQGLFWSKAVDPSQLGNVPMSNSLLANGVAGDASDIDGQAERPNGPFGKGDIEGKAAMVAASELGSERVQTSGSE
jgi:hypothetical protein